MVLAQCARNFDEELDVFDLLMSWGAKYLRRKHMLLGRR